ncbi:hypothetical protein GCM10023156_00030 [Novipirellula rosea]|uniref:Glycosyl transferase family 2 n=2 Tax=Novipirellula rosea TaxID=1031540 RepID=A0ABP8M5F5_9BACT
MFGCPVSKDENHVADLILEAFQHAAQASPGWMTPKSWEDIFVEADRTFLVSTPEFDPYRATRDENEYCGAWSDETGLTPQWATSDAPRAIAYLRADNQLVPRCQLLSQIGLEIVLVSDGSVPESIFEIQRLRLAEGLVKTAHSDAPYQLVVCNANHGLTLRALELQVPVLMFPSYIEHRWNAKVVEQLGFGVDLTRVPLPHWSDSIDRLLTHAPNDAHFASFSKKLRATNNASFAATCDGILQWLEIPQQNKLASSLKVHRMLDRDRIESRLDRSRQTAIKQVQSFQIIRRGEKLAQDEILVVMVVYNEEVRLPDTINHYRRLGANRFAIIDNGSTDATREFLQSQTDVDLFYTDLDFRDGNGCGWASAMIHHYYGVNRWVICSDADEQLVYDDCESRSLAQLCSHLHALRIKSMPALMVEMYSDTSIGSTVLLKSQRLLDRCPWFDGEGYSRQVNYDDTTGTQVRWIGGPSERLFGVDRGWQAKTPLVYWEPETWLWNPHVIFPFEHNHTPMNGVLLHFKYLSDFMGAINRSVQRQQHAAKSRKYKQFQKAMFDLGDPCLMNESSKLYVSSDSLIEPGLMSSITWDAS